MTIKPNEPKQILNYFLYLSLTCLILAGIFVIIDAIHGHFIIDDADYFLAFLGIICLTLGLAASNKLEIELLKQQSKPGVNTNSEKAKLSKFDFGCGCIGVIYSDNSFKLDPPCQKHANQIWKLATFNERQSRHGVEQ